MLVLQISDEAEQQPSGVWNCLRCGTTGYDSLAFVFGTTTGDVLFAEGFWLCRGLYLGHSVKGVFVEDQLQEPSAKLGPQQAFAEGLALGKQTALSKINLCRGPNPQQISPRQIWPDG